MKRTNPFDLLPQEPRFVGQAEPIATLADLNLSPDPKQALPQASVDDAPKELAVDASKAGAGESVPAPRLAEVIPLPVVPVVREIERPKSTYTHAICRDYSPPEPPEAELNALQRAVIRGLRKTGAQLETISRVWRLPMHQVRRICGEEPKPTEE